MGVFWLRFPFSKRQWGRISLLLLYFGVGFEEEWINCWRGGLSLGSNCRVVLQSEGS